MNCIVFLAYTSSFIPKMSDYMASHRELMKEDMESQWITAYQKYYDELREIIYREMELF